ncbi:hypothetical protein BDN70DRAFT_880504 [Pholiota conissans]|uniref:Uncharacterized protein n=1 Tax=Pholiota conissans TaxID=109636 RepID=A0A9P6CSA2_9AGAR|nr:hypothetical protein BDN70DRAFT_880504 [Pholiota conissans]
MPGPSNMKGKKKPRNKKASNGSAVQRTREPSKSAHTSSQQRAGDKSSERSSASTPSIKTPPPISYDPPSVLKGQYAPCLDEEIPKKVEEVMLQEPFIHDPGNGPRVRDAKAFMASFFALPPSMDDPMCAEFAQEEVLQMLCTVLPEELALILWYNKSRSESRVCPACQRLYRLGDVLPGLLDENPTADKAVSPQLSREQAISGLCSPVCFIMASFNYPTAIKSAWGTMADEMDDTTWELLNIPDDEVYQSSESRALGMLVRMTRLHDLGLAQLCFDPDEISHLQEGHAQPVPVL